MIEVTESKRAQCSYQGQPHHWDQQALTWYYMVEVIFADEVEGEERVQSTADPQKWEIQTHVRCQTNTSTHIHIYKDKKSNTNGRTARYTTCQSTRNISAALSQRWHNPKSTWLKLDLSNSAQTVSVTSKSFGPDWQHSATLVTVAALPRQVTGVCACARSNTLTHKRKHTIIAEMSLELFFVSSEC